MHFHLPYATIDWSLIWHRHCLPTLFACALFLAIEHALDKIIANNQQQNETRKCGYKESVFSPANKTTQIGTKPNGSSEAKQSN